ncbi:Ca-activated chloride channel family protein [Hymenobacter daecheongensis DSM 21074]|uniref:Ca-activated chloride channel family protein n=1 Tax=Hymenobacter daecheongensis DSM 21074 TaxID=1121955 RepID=A0A1M6I3H8_9BACT|nr:VWA domain-containing protein [Hymenobacter daecheongensis]SHJ28894.1 Ca-activated chloride channel family protein [Hymenobacter daecheongensis DSM 21074]
MRRLLLTLCSFLFLAFGPGQALRAQNAEPEKPRTTRILFVLDASGSMMAPWEGRPRWDVARGLLSKMVDSLNAYPNLQLGLRAYGHQHPNSENNCEDSRLEVPFAPKNAKAIKARLSTLKAQGNTPITYSILQAASDFPPDKTSRNVLILITDGLESCKGDPCATSVALQRKHVFLRPFIIGLGAERDFGKQLECLGQYYNAADVNTFRTILDNVISQTLTKTTVSVNLTDENGRPVESNVNMTFVNNVTETPEYNYVHYRDAQGKADVLDIDALQSYDLVINTVPPVRQPNLPIRPGKANVLTYKTPQGTLSLQSPNISPNPYGKVEAVVRAAGNPATVVSLPFGTKQKLLAGNYEVELLTLPRIVRRISIRQGQETAVAYDAPGALNIVTDLKGYGSIYKLNNDESQTWVYNLPEGSSKLTLPMQPGAYRLVFRTKTATGSKFTDVRNFTIRSGQTSSVSMFGK